VSQDVSYRMMHLFDSEFLVFETAYSNKMISDILYHSEVLQHYKYLGKSFYKAVSLLSQVLTGH